MALVIAQRTSKPSAARAQPRDVASVWPKRKGRGRTRFLTHWPGRAERKSALSVRRGESAAGRARSWEEAAAIDFILRPIGSDRRTGPTGPQTALSASPHYS